MLAGSQMRESATDRQPEENKSVQSLTFNDPLWPMQWELVGVIVYVCVYVCVCSPGLCGGLLSLLSALVRMVRDVPLTGISQPGFHV